MTNYEIIMRESFELVKSGVLTTIGDTGIPEEIHSFQDWKSRGLLVKKGEHAIAKFPVWIPYDVEVKRENSTGDAKESAPLKSTKFKMRDTAFFKASQVETAEERENAKAAAAEENAADCSAPEELEKPKEPEVKTQAKTAAPKKAKKIIGRKVSEIKKIIKVLNESALKKHPSRHILVERDVDDVYVCDGFVMFKTTNEDYNDFFRPAKKYYPELKGKEQWMIYDKDDVSRLDSKDVLKGLWEENAEKATDAVTITDMVKENDKFTFRGLMLGDEVMAVQERYIQAFGTDRDWKGSTPVSPIMCNDAMILPVRTSEEFNEKVKNANK